MFKKFLGIVALSGFIPLSAYAQLNVFSCEPEWAQLASELGAQHVKARSATTAYQDPHYIQARPSLIAKARRADLLICTGAELEVGWLPVLLERSANAAIQPGKLGHFMAADFVDMMEKLDRVDSSMGHVHAAGNPHFQTDPRRMIQVAKALTQRLIDLDPANADDYRAQGNAFQQRMTSSIQQWSTQASALKGLPIVVHHRSWVYMNDWLGLNEVATLEPKPGIPPSTAHLSQPLEQMKNDPAKAIIYSAYQSPKAADWLSNRTQIPALKLNSTVLPDQSLHAFYQSLIDSLLEVAQ